MARISMNLGRFEEAAEYFDKVIELAVSAANAEAHARAMCGKASCLFYLKRMNESQDIATEALELASQHELETVVAMAQSVLALERLAIGDHATPSSSQTTTEPFESTSSNCTLTTSVFDVGTFFPT